MINYFYKEDMESAERDFSQFCEQTQGTEIFSKSVEFAKQYLREIKEKLEGH
jgi:hypothetical protein